VLRRAQRDAEGMQNGHMDRNRRCGRDWPDRSVATMLEWVPVNSAEMRSAAVSPHVITVKEGESASAE
jgi:hypothetical protein